MNMRAGLGPAGAILLAVSILGTASEPPTWPDTLGWTMNRLGNCL